MSVKDLVDADLLRRKYKLQSLEHNQPYNYEVQDNLKQHHARSTMLTLENTALEREVFAMRDMEAKISKGGVVQERRKGLAKEVREKPGGPGPTALQ